MGLALLLAACRPDAATQSPEDGSADATSSEGDTAEDELTFAWPANASATVTEKVLKKGQNITMRYRIVTTPAEDGFTLAYRDLEVLAMDGVDMTKPDAKAMLEAVAQQIYASFPPFAISGEGYWVGIGELEQILPALQGAVSAETLGTLERMLEDPNMRAMLDALLQKAWSNWVGHWNGLRAAPGEAFGVEIPNAIDPEGEPWQMAYEYVAREGKEAHLAAQFELAGEAAKVAMGPAILSLVQAAAPPGEQVDAEMMRSYIDGLDVGILRQWEVRTDVDTMLPSWAASVARIQVRGNGEDRDELETHEYAFVWD